MSLTQAPTDPSQFLTRSAEPVVDQAGSAGLKLANATIVASTIAVPMIHTIQRRKATRRVDAGVLVRADRTRRLPAGRKMKLLMRENIRYFISQRNKKGAVQSQGAFQVE